MRKINFILGLLIWAAFNGAYFYIAYNFYYNASQHLFYVFLKWYVILFAVTTGFLYWKYISEIGFVRWILNVLKRLFSPLSGFYYDPRISQFLGMFFVLLMVASFFLMLVYKNAYWSAVNGDAVFPRDLSFPEMLWYLGIEMVSGQDLTPPQRTATRVIMLLVMVFTGLIVFFYIAAWKERLDRKLRHSRLKDKPPGYNLHDHLIFIGKLNSIKAIVKNINALGKLNLDMIVVSPELNKSPFLYVENIYHKLWGIEGEIGDEDVGRLANLDTAKYAIFTDLENPYDLMIVEASEKNDHKIYSAVAVRDDELFKMAMNFLFRENTPEQEHYRRNVDAKNVGVDFLINARTAVDRLVAKSQIYSGTIRLVYELFSLGPLNYLYPSVKCEEKKRRRFNGNHRYKKLNAQLSFDEVKSSGRDNWEIRLEYVRKKKELPISIWEYHGKKYGIILKLGINKKNLKIRRVECSGIELTENSQNQVRTLRVRDLKNQFVEEILNCCYNTPQRQFVDEIIDKCCDKVIKNYLDQETILNLPNDTGNVTNEQVCNSSIIVETQNFSEERVLHLAWSRMHGYRNLCSGGKNIPFLETVSEEGLSAILLSQVVNHGIIPYLIYDLLDIKNDDFPRNPANGFRRTENLTLKRYKVTKNGCQYYNLLLKLLRDGAVVQSGEENEKRKMILLGVQKPDKFCEVWVHALDEIIEPGDYIFVLE